MSMKLHSEMSGEILAGVGISQLIFFCCWNRAVSLSTCLIKCRHFQQAVLCVILWDTSPVCPSWIERRRAPGQPWCLNGVREGNSAASRILSWMWELAVPRAADSLVARGKAPVQLMRLLRRIDTAWTPLPQWSLHSTGVDSADQQWSFFKPFENCFHFLFLKLQIEVWKPNHETNSKPWNYFTRILSHELQPFFLVDGWEERIKA